MLQKPRQGKLITGEIHVGLTCCQLGCVLLVLQGVVKCTLLMDHPSVNHGETEKFPSQMMEFGGFLLDQNKMEDSGCFLTYSENFSCCSIHVLYCGFILPK